MANEFNIKVDRVKIHWASKSMHNCDVQCALCERPIANRVTTHVAKAVGKNEQGETIFVPVPENELPNDPVEWGTFIGPHCGKLLPKTHRVTYKKLLKNHSDTWC